MWDPALIAPGERAEASSGWRCLGTEQERDRAAGPQGSSALHLASSGVCPIYPERTCQPDGEKQSRSCKSQGLRSRPREASWGPGPLPAPAFRLWLPGELPPTRSLSLAPEQSKLCVQGWHCSLPPPRANTSPESQAQPGPTALARSSRGGGRCKPWPLLRRASTLCLPTSAETQTGPQNTLDYAQELRKQIMNASWPR